jgi:ABC-type multidrug transport system fused ATPase/permease subunit
VLLFSFFFFTIISLFKKSAELSIEAKKRYNQDNKVIFERINSLEFIKTVSGEKYEEKKVSEQLDETFEKNKKSLFFLTLFKAVPNYFIIPNMNIFFALCACFLSSQKKNSIIFTVTNFLNYYIVVGKLNGEINKITESFLNFDELSDNLSLLISTINKMENNEVENENVEEQKELDNFKNGEIRFQDVVFAYPGRQDILKKFSFCFEKGKTYGIAGKNGIGKSTITKTTLKLYDLKEGEITINKKNIEEINTSSLQNKICHQTNKPGFFRMSIAENVFYPHLYKETDQKKLEYAARKVGVFDFISKLKNGFETEILERGANLSEGQKQQIFAMKIFIRDYDIYILDEILSNVHPILRSKILKNIFSKIKGKTVLVIDHHYEIFNYADEIYMFTGEKLIPVKDINKIKEKRQLKTEIKDKNE